MEYKTVFNGVKLPAIGLGTWQMGGRHTVEHEHDHEDINAIREAIKLGMTHIDTAEEYALGHAEELVGEAIKDFDRDTLFITSKVKPENFAYDDVIAACKRSLARLQIDYLDLYLLHSPESDVPRKETMKAMNDLIDQGLIKRIGISNFSVEQMKEVQALTKHPIVTNQIHYSLLTRNNSKFLGNVEKEVIPYCQEQGITITAFRPLEKGELCKPGHAVLDELAAKYDKTPSQIALNWVISKENVITIIKSSNLEHLKENLGAMGWKMDPEDLKRLDTEMGE